MKDTWTHIMVGDLQENTVIDKNSYSIDNTSNTAKELLNIFKNVKNKRIGTSSCTNDSGSIVYKIFSFTYDDFIEEFKTYSNFKKVCNQIKLDTYATDKDRYVVDIFIREDLC